MKERETHEQIGRRGALGGFQHERQVRDELNNWQQSSLAQSWLRTMGIALDEVRQVQARRSSGHTKTDVEVRVLLKSGKVHISNISCKKGGGNQIDKRRVDEYVNEFAFSETTRNALKKFTGEQGSMPEDLWTKGLISQSRYSSLKDKRRFTFPELELYEQQAILTDFQQHKDAIIQFLLQGNDKDAPQWFMKDLKLIPMAKAICLARDDGRVAPTRTGFRIGDIKVQRKGGTPDPTKLQFKWDGIS